MKFKKISIENFKSIGSNPVVVNLDFNNTTLLTGSNGVGKTSITEAIVWCIYGVTKLKADNVVNKTVGEGTKVELEFTENNRDYVITRYRKHKVHKNNVYIFEDGKNISLKNQVDNQELIQKIIGIDSRAFMSSIVLSSETYKQFLRETNSVRLQIFESVFSLRELNDFKKYTSQKIKTLEGQISVKNGELVSVSSYNEADTNSLKAYKENYNSQIEKLDAQIELYKLNLAKCEEDLKNGSEIDFDAEMKKAVEYQVKLKEFESKKSELGTIKRDLEYAIEEQKNFELKICEYEETLKKYSLSELKAEVKKNSEYEAFVNKKNELEKLILEKNGGLKHKISDLKNLENKLSEYTVLRGELLDKIQNVNLSVCPVCGNHLVDSKASELKSGYIAKLSQVDAGIQEKTCEIESCKKEIEDLNAEISDLTNQLNSLVIEKPKYSIAEIKMIAEKIKEAETNIAPYTKKSEEKTNQISELKKRIEIYSLGELPKYDGYTVEWLNENKSKQVKLASEVESLKNQISITMKMKEAAFDRNYVQKLMMSIKERNAIIERLNSEIFNFRKEIAQYQVLDDIFSNGENSFKKYFINKTIDMFNDKINTFLPFFFDDEIEIKFDKNLNESIMFRGKETDFEELSSGEKTRAELCVIFSLYFMVQSLFGCGTNLLVVDELLDRGLDEKGIKASKAILDDISKESSVFVVTHRDDLKELFNSVLTVYKDGDGFTRTK